MDTRNCPKPKNLMQQSPVATVEAKIATESFGSLDCYGRNRGCFCQTDPKAPKLACVLGLRSRKWVSGLGSESGFG